MNKCFCICFFIVLAFSFTSCSRKQETKEDVKNPVIVNSKFAETIDFNADSVIKRSLAYETLSNDTSKKAFPIRAGAPSKKSFSLITQKEIPKRKEISGVVKNLIPGKDGVLLPKTIKIEPVKTTFAENAPIKTQPMKYSDIIGLNLQYLSEEQNLGTSAIYSILQDNKGNMWFGTFGAGALKYDGKTVSRYSPGVNFFAELVQHLAEDKDGNIWFGPRTGNSIVRYNGKEFHRYTFEDSTELLSLFSAHTDKHGNIWFGTNLGALQFNGHSFVQFTSQNGLSDIIMDICEDKNGRIWFATLDDGIVCFDGKQFTHYAKENGLISNQVYAIEIDKNNSLWIGTDNGVMRFDGNAFEIFNTGPGACNKIIKDIKADSHGNIWFATLGKGIYRYSEEAFHSITKKDGLLSDFVWCFEEDDAGSLWIGSANGGINKLAFNGIRHITSKDGLSSESVYPVIERKNGEIWAGTLYSSLVKFNNDFIEEYTTSEALPDNTIFGMCEDKDNNLWLGFETAGIAKFNGSTFTHYLKKNGLPSDNIETLASDYQGNIWIGSVTELTKFDGNQFTVLKWNGESLPASFVFHDTKNGIWFGGPLNGLYQIVDNQLYYYTFGSGFLYPEVECAYQDSYGNMWFGLTKNGVCRFDGSTFTYISLKEGMTNNCVRTIVEDKNKNIWMGTDNGITILNPEADPNVNPVNYSLKTLEKSDGLYGLEFRSLKIDRKNNLWASTGKGMTIIDLDEFSFQNLPPKISLQNILIKQQFIDYRRIIDTSYLNSIPFGNFLKNSFDSVPAFCNNPIGLKLSYHLNHLTFNLSAIDWHAPYKIKYQYRILGVDDDWSDLSDDGIADYRNIPPGKHTFVARALGGANLWSRELTYTFTILPPWWRTWWAFSFYAIALVFIILVYRKRLIKREQQKSELKIKQIEVAKMKDLGEHKSHFFANISHEFRTPLSLILGSIDEIKESEIQLDEYQKPLQVMQRNSERLYRLVNQLLELSKLDEGKMKLKLSHGNISESIRYIKASYESMAERKKIKFLFQEPEIDEPIYWDQEKLEIIVHNLLSNAFRFTPEYGKIVFQYGILLPIESMEDLKKAGRRLFIEISDTGPGIEKDKLEKLFVRFEKLADDKKLYREGMGIGLALTKELVDFQKGHIEVESVLNKRTTFKLYLPCDFEAFDNAEIIEYQKSEIVDKNAVISGELLPVPVSPAIKTRKEKEKAIIIVEDNLDMLQFLERKLAESYNIEPAGNGKLAWQRILDLLPDLVVTDLMMPEIDGMELCKLIKEDQRTSHIPVIILTAKASIENRIDGFKTGADDYLEKPFKIEELLARIENLILQREKLKNKYVKMMGFETETIQVTGMDEQFLKKALSEVEKNLLNAEWNVNKFSESMNMSHSQLFRKLKVLTEMSVTDFILSIRLKKAARLLEKNAGTITEIASQVGFNDSSYFTKCFKKEFKVSPRSYALKFKNQ
ncbi:MAG: two-component regulator propeller domain-containing protein [Bacteroidales bacterium]|nr:two-component regulator propeller domain-containing protein [Bacteroidales bacterium]